MKWISYLLILLPFFCQDLFSLGPKDKWEKGDAIYRKLQKADMGWVTNHWHSAIFVGITFEHDGTSFQGKAIGKIFDHAVKSANHMKTHEKTELFDIRLGINLATKMTTSLVNVWGSVNEGWSLSKYYGAYAPISIQPGAKRGDVIGQALDLINQNIFYPGMGGDMLRFNGWGPGNDWDGTVADIKDLRCDGVIEYSWEKQGVIVWRALDPARINLASASSEKNVDAHNSFHYSDYETDELCPKIQANETGNRSDMRPSDPLHPTMAPILVSGQLATDPQTSKITFDLDFLDSQSEQVFVTMVILDENDKLTDGKILVDKTGTPFALVPLGLQNGTRTIEVEWDGTVTDFSTTTRLTSDIGLFVVIHVYDEGGNVGTKQKRIPESPIKNFKSFTGHNEALITWEKNFPTFNPDEYEVRTVIGNDPPLEFTSGAPDATIPVTTAMDYSHNFSLTGDGTLVTFYVRAIKNGAPLLFQSKRLSVILRTVVDPSGRVKSLVSGTPQSITDIQEALDLAEVGSGTNLIYVMNGTYSSSLLINPEKNIHLLGQSNIRTHLAGPNPVDENTIDILGTPPYQNTGVTIENFVIRHGTAGIGVGPDVPNVIIKRNVFHDNFNRAIFINRSAEVTVINNTMIRNGEVGVLIVETGSQTSQIIIDNNIFYIHSLANVMIEEDVDPPNSLRNNRINTLFAEPLFAAGATAINDQPYASGNIDDPPAFADFNNFDFRLRLVTGVGSVSLEKSPLVDGGVDGFTDIGAIEWSLIWGIFSPIDVTVENSIGEKINADINEIGNGSFFESKDDDVDGEFENIIHIPFVETGIDAYKATITAKAGFFPANFFSLKSQVNDLMLLEIESEPVPSVPMEELISIDAIAPPTPTNLRSTFVTTVDSIIEQVFQPLLKWDFSGATDLLGFNIYRGETAGFAISDSNLVTAHNSDVFEYMVEELNSGTYFYKITAVDLFFNESMESNEIQVVIGGQTELFVDDGGSDVTGTGTFGNPFKTVQHAYDQIPDQLAVQPYYINILPGTYQSTGAEILNTTGTARDFSATAFLVVKSFYDQLDSIPVVSSNGGTRIINISKSFINIDHLKFIGNSNSTPQIAIEGVDDLLIGINIQRCFFVGNINKQISNSIIFPNVDDLRIQNNIFVGPFIGPSVTYALSTGLAQSSDTRNDYLIANNTYISNRGTEFDGFWKEIELNKLENAKFVGNIVFGAKEGINLDSDSGELSVKKSIFFNVDNDFVETENATLTLEDIFNQDPDFISIDADNPLIARIQGTSVAIGNGATFEDDIRILPFDFYGETELNSDDIGAIEHSRIDQKVVSVTYISSNTSDILDDSIKIEFIESIIDDSLNTNQGEADQIVDFFGLGSIDGATITSGSIDNDSIIYMVMSSQSATMSHLLSNLIILPGKIYTITGSVNLIDTLIITTFNVRVPGVGFFETISEAFDSAAAGDSIVVIDVGLYPETLTVDKNITFVGLGDGVNLPVWQSTFDRDTIVYITDTATIVGFVFDGQDSAEAIAIANSNHYTIVRNILTNCGNSSNGFGAISLRNSMGRIEGNLIHSSQKGIYSVSADNANNFIGFNTVVQNAAVGIAVQSAAGTPDTVKYNIAWSNEGNDLDSTGTNATPVANFNVFQTVTNWKTGANSFNLFAEFVDTTNNDFHLLPTSPFINFSDVTVAGSDIDGKSRPTPAGTQWDLGAFEETTEGSATKIFIAKTGAAVFPFDTPGKATSDPSDAFDALAQGRDTIVFFETGTYTEDAALSFNVDSVVVLVQPGAVCTLARNDASTDSSEIIFVQKKHIRIFDLALDGNGVAGSGVAVDNNSVDEQFWRLDIFEISDANSNNKNAGIAFRDNGQDGKVMNCRIHDFTGTKHSGIVIQKQSNNANHIEIARNEIFNINSAAISIRQVKNRNIYIHHNLIYNCDEGITGKAGNPGAGGGMNDTIIYNTVFNCNPGINMRGHATADSNNVYRFNIVWNNKNGRDFAWMSKGTVNGWVFDHNVYDSLEIGIDAGAGDITTYPEFIDSTGPVFDFNLQTTSLAIGASNDQTAFFDFDSTLTPRPTGSFNDLGALEEVTFAPPDTIAPVNDVTLIATALSKSSIQLTWNPGVIEEGDADSVGIWFKTGDFPDSALDPTATLVGLFTLSDSVDTVISLDSSTVYFFSLVVHDTNGNWSDTSASASDTARTFGTTPDLAWWDTNWLFRRILTIDRSFFSTDHDSFTALVLIDNNRIDYSNTQDAGQDIRFVGEDDSTVLDYEIEVWNESGTSFVWVQLGTLNASRDDSIFMYYGNSSAGDSSDTNGTWDSRYVAVYHFHDDSLDHSGTGNSIATITGDPTPDVAGRFGNTYDFDGAADGLFATDDATFKGLSALTVTAWMKPRNDFSNQDDKGCIVCKRRTGARREFGIRLSIPTGEIEFAISNDGTNEKEVTIDTSNFTVDEWNFIAASWDAATDSFFIYDGSSVGDQDTFVSAALNSGNTDLTVGAHDNSASQGDFDGAIDEVRVLNEQMSHEWVEIHDSSYNDNLLIFSGEENVPAKQAGPGKPFASKPPVLLGKNLVSIYPNPFTHKTEISYRVVNDKPGFRHVILTKLSIYDIHGKEIKRLVDDWKRPGRYTIEWDGKNSLGLSVKDGLYLYQLITGEEKEAGRLMLMK